MRILMFGWEYSPRHTGGLGVVCKSLCDELAKEHAIRFILPAAEKPVKKAAENISIKAVAEIPAENIEKKQLPEQVKMLEVGSRLVPYLPKEVFRENQEAEQKPNHETELLRKIPLTGKYDQNLSAEVTKFTLLSSDLYEDENYDIIHAHDWLGAHAGLLAKAILKIPLVFHIHSTESDRNGMGGNEQIRSVERRAIEMADAVVCVSEKTKRDIIAQYDAEEEKITVVPNATAWRMNNKPLTPPVNTNIGFLGRLTDQKAPGRLVDVARLLENEDAGFTYTVMGDGYLADHLAGQIKKYNLAGSFRLKGFLPPEKVRKELSKLSLLVVPSVSEPFGLVALEATARGIPVIISENAGVNDYMPFKTFRQWDLHAMKDLILSLVGDESYSQQYLSECRKAMRKLSWKKSAAIVTSLYEKLIRESQIPQ